MPNGSFVLVKSEDAILAEVNKGNAITVEQDDIHLSFAMRTWCDLVHMPVSFLFERFRYEIFRQFFGPLFYSKICLIFPQQKHLNTLNLALFKKLTTTYLESIPSNEKVLYIPQRQSH
jgi:hypothetical protein